MTDSTENTILYYDFIEKNGYLAQLFEYQSIYVCQKLHSLNIPGRTLELGSFRASLKLMFVWKSHMINLNNSITLANLNREQKFQLADISSTINPPRLPNRNVHPVHVYLSLANANKRSHSVFEKD